MSNRSSSQPPRYFYIALGFFMGSLFIAACDDDRSKAIAHGIIEAFMVVFDDTTNSLNGIDTQLALEDAATRLDSLDTTAAGHAATSHAHGGADITSGTVPFGQLPTGATATDVAVGNHVHTALSTTYNNGASGLSASDLKNAIDEVVTRIATLESLTNSMSVINNDVFFTGVNVNVRSGGTATDDTPDGTGNLIVGFNEFGQGYPQTGSHNIIVGKDHGYTSYGGLVAGFANRITSTYASVSGGRGNIASGDYSSISGGTSNTTNGAESSVSGGQSRWQDKNLLRRSILYVCFGASKYTLWNISPRAYRRGHSHRHRSLEHR